MRKQLWELEFAGEHPATYQFSQDFGANVEMSMAAGIRRGLQERSVKSAVEEFGNSLADTVLSQVSAAIARAVMEGSGLQDILNAVAGGLSGMKGLGGSEAPAGQGGTAGTDQPATSSP